MRIDPIQSDRFFVGIAVCLFFFVCCWFSYVPDKTKQLEWQQDSIKYWKLKNAMINIGIEDIVEIEDGVSEIRRVNRSVETRHP